MPTKIWNLSDQAKFATFRQVTEVTRLAPNKGLPGRVLTSGKPLWVPNVTEDANFPRAKLAADVGVRAGSKVCPAAR